MLVRRLVWLPLGLVCVGLGALGVVVPGLPTTIFMIMAAACFSRSSPRLEQWVLDLPKVGPMVRDHRAGLGMPRRAKLLASTMIVVAVSLSAWAIGPLAVSALVVALGLVGLWYVLLHTPTHPGHPERN